MTEFGQSVRDVTQLGKLRGRSIYRLLLAGVLVTPLTISFAYAQQPGITLPPVSVEASKAQPKAKAKQAAPKSAPASAPIPVVAPSPIPRSPMEQATGPVQGFVANQSATGTKTGTPLIETPQSISVVTRDQIEQQGAESVSDALHYTPGVIVDVRPASRYDIVNIRGLGNLQSFVHFQDGLKLQRGLNFDVPVMDPYLLERIEVFRGPASVLYGQVGVGGLVNFVSKKPTDDPFGEIAVTFGTHVRKQVAFDFGGPVDRNGEFSYRLTGLARDTGTDIYGVDEERYAIAPSFTWRPSTSTTLTLLASYLNDPESSYSVGVPALGSGLPSPNGKIPHFFNPGDPAYDTFKREQTAIGYLFEHKFDPTWTVRQNFRYMNLDTTFAALQTSGLTGTNISRNKSLTINGVDTYAVDNQAEAKFATGVVKHTMLFGLDYQFASANAALSGGGPGAAAPTIDYLNPVYGLSVARPAIATRNKSETDQLGIYAQEQVKIGNLVGVLGARYDWASYDFEQTTLASGQVSKTDQKDEAFTWRGGLLYHFDSGFSPYFSYSTSFEPITGTAIDYQGNPFKPTTGEQFEIGVKYQPPGVNAFITVSLFDIRLQDVLTTDTDHVYAPPPATSYPCAPNANTLCQTQTGEVRSRGIEIEARASLNDNLDIAAAYTYIDAEITKSDTTFPGGISEKGKRPTAVPEHMAAIWAFYTFHDGMLRGFGLGGGLRYMSETYGNRTNTWTVDPVFLVDAAARYDFGAVSTAYEGYSLQLNATNLFDKEYLASCGQFGGGFPATEPTNSGCYYGAGRNIMATLKYQW
ncbi:TonB-dependent siderophore receptor [Leptospira interrogans]